MVLPTSTPKDNLPVAAKPESLKDDGENAHVGPVIATVDIEGPVVTKKELWSYYLYASGDNGAGPVIYSLTLFQALATAAAYDGTLGPGNPCGPKTPSSACLLPWGSGTKTVSSIVLVASGVSFAIMTVLFTLIGSAADYGSFGRWLLLIMTVICWGTQFSSLALTSPNRWGLALALYIIGYVSYSATYVFFYAHFPRLARNTEYTRRHRRMYEKGEITAEEYELAESLEKGRICTSGIASAFTGYAIILLLNLSILIPLAKNPKVDNYTIVMMSAFWIATGIWWFIFQQPRPGPPLPEGASYLTIGYKQVWEACKQYKKLPYTFIYLVAFFILSDGTTTTLTLVAICQNDVFQFSFLRNAYLGICQTLSSALSLYVCGYVQRRWKIGTKKMFVFGNIASIIIPFWGMLGIWTNKIGFHNPWEFWVYAVVNGLFQVPFYAYYQAMMAELAPPGFDNMFFGLLGLSVRASSLMGPNVIQAIIDRTRSNWQGFPFLFALCVFSSPIIWFGVDVQKGRRDAVRFSEEKRGVKLDGASASSESADSTKL